MIVWVMIAMIGGTSYIRGALHLMYFKDYYMSILESLLCVCIVCIFVSCLTFSTQISSPSMKCLFPMGIAFDAVARVSR